MKKILIFPAPFLIKNPTADQQNDYLFFIAERKPDWVIASGEPATACIVIHAQKKILINPTVTFNDLNNVPECARRYTYCLFGALSEHQRSYELFQSVYPNVAWFVNAPNLSLIDIKDISTEIINDKLNE